ncbi:MAG: alpha/beta hydrolase [Planctomycetota bacterium]
MSFFSLKFETPWRRWAVYLLWGIPALYLIYIAVMYTFQNKFVFPGAGKSIATPAQMEMPFEDVTLMTPDGARLSAWFIPGAKLPATDAKPSGAAPGKPACALFCEGNAENCGDRLDQIFYWHRLGVSVFIWDYRGYGSSTGHATIRHERADVKVALAYVLGRPDVDPAKIILDGHSIGTGVCGTLLPDFQPAAIVLEAPFSSLVQAAQDQAPLVPVRWLLSDNYDTDAKLKNYDGPVLILASRKDELFKPIHAERLHRACKNGTLLWDDGTHPEQRQGAMYGTVIEAFLTENKLIGH